jgi:2-keto-4-pentenoate hydratase/2-oxohepta-3-ene-1,7-dioic acid hydratase in catechol pathway
MLWGRVIHADRTVFGPVVDDTLHVHHGDMFAGARPTGEILPLAEVTWLTPCQPSKMIALWNNYRQAGQRNGWDIPTEPLYFAKTANSFNAHLRTIPVPRSYDGRVVYEGELGIVIGRTCSDVPIAEARHSIFGYTCINDVTALDLIAGESSFPQWTRAKCLDGFGVFGPLIATEIEPLDLTIRTLVNGRERQNYPTSDMIFKPTELVSLLSRDMTLLPGDVIACGTSLGVLPMRPGVTIEVAIDGIGVLRNAYQ